LATQLTAKNRDGNRTVYPFSYDGITQADIDWLTQFSRDNLNVSPSVSTILRAALSHYRSHLMEQATSIRDLDDLTAFIQENRDLLFFVSGHPEKAYDKRYHTMEGEY